MELKSRKKLFQLLRQATLESLTYENAVTPLHSMFIKYRSLNHFQVTILLHITLRGQELMTKLLTGICAWT